MWDSDDGPGRFTSYLAAAVAALLERQAQVRGKVLSTLAYPVILAIVATFVVFALMIFVVPKVVEQFQDVGQELPLLTRIVIGLSNFLAAWWWALLIALAAAVLVGARALKEEGLRMKFDAFLLRLPLVGRLIRDLHAARMARTLSTMVASRLPLLEGLTLTSGTVHNRVLRRASQDIAESIRAWARANSDTEITDNDCEWLAQELEKRAR